MVRRWRGFGRLFGLCGNRPAVYQYGGVIDLDGHLIICEDGRGLGLCHGVNGCGVAGFDASHLVALHLAGVQEDGREQEAKQ